MPQTIERTFDINIVLMTVYAALETVRESEHIELVFDMDSTVPKELEGDADALTHLLTQTLHFVIKQAETDTIVLHLSAPEDFVYMEEVRFAIDTAATSITRLKAEGFFASRLQVMAKRLDATLQYDEENDQLVFSVPLKIKELGNRRFYRLPDMRMVGKKMLLICQNVTVAQSIKKMFRYFLYEVDEGPQAYKERGSNLAYYDIFLLDRALLNDGIIELVRKVQAQQTLKFVLLDEPNFTRRLPVEETVVSAYLVKPVLQESVFELIVSLYESESKRKVIEMHSEKPVIDLSCVIDEAFRQSEEATVRVQDEIDDVLQSEAIFDLLTPLKTMEYGEGKNYAVSHGERYDDLLRRFLDTFSRSDYYFREIAKGHAEWQIKEFLKDLETQAVQIGAKRLAKLAEYLHVLYVYKEWERLNRLTDLYHTELTKAVIEITHYLKKHSKA